MLYFPSKILIEYISIILSHPLSLVSVGSVFGSSAYSNALTKL